ncbi:MAG: DDE-type integrase/transposase/recombinase [Alicyclobacillus herbarius]|nr:DDE-type integrase/transposase/recombinase [Alicyclobacillus herbarius]MCL6633813.1 DDE-type integrase/transposase/recombinase [Alicyclobacillus herbarius]
MQVRFGKERQGNSSTTPCLLLHCQWLYLASIMDLFTRKIVGWHADSRMTKALALQALEMAIRRERPTSPVIHHSDRDSQYASHAYQDNASRQSDAIWEYIELWYNRQGVHLYFLGK